MNRPVYVLLGRAGDIISSLPFMQHDAKDGKRPILVTSSPFHEILEGQTQVECVLSPAPAGDIPKAIEFAKTLSSDVRCLHVQVTPDETKTGKFKNIQTDSFVKELHRLAGHYDLFKQHLPPTFDRRDATREEALMPDEVLTRQPTILVALGGVSSPFKYRKLAMKLIELRFKRPWKIIDLTKIKAHRLYDLLGLMERAKFLVATDSAVLHLARAVPTVAVLALQADRPSLWNGSPWRPEWLWSCRYSDFPVRGASMLDAMADAYHGGLAYLPTIKREKSIVHLFSAYEGINNEAKSNWKHVYDNVADWIHTPAHFGVFGRDSRTALQGERLCAPFVKDLIRIGMARSIGASDAICLTRSDTCFWKPKEALPEPPFFSHRTTQSTDGKPIHHPAVDVFCFTKEWWQKHVAEFPDMVMGRDYYWQRVLKELILRHGGREVFGLTYQAVEEK